jgi:hypothetical protein
MSHVQYPAETISTIATNACHYIQGAAFQQEKKSSYLEVSLIGPIVIIPGHPDRVERA